ncbi:MAG: hypothetical protein SFX74_09100 [Fimbriimonadaceae bacterium]|nr:hypothetical protein [Fimbriimonadaceae bacterium]
MSVEVPESLKAVPVMGGATLRTQGGRYTEKEDPLADSCFAAIAAIEKSLGKPIETVLPDPLAIVLMFDSAQLPLEAALRRTAGIIDWSATPTGLRGTVSAGYAHSAAQVNREALRAWSRNPTVMDTPRMAAFEAKLSSSSSESMMDVLALAMVGASIAIGVDHPYSTRLYRALTSRDWARLNAGCAVSELGFPAQSQLKDLVEHSRAHGDETYVVSRRVAIKRRSLTKILRVPKGGVPRLDEPTAVAGAMNWSGYQPHLNSYAAVRVEELRLFWQDAPNRELTVFTAAPEKMPTPGPFSSLPEQVQKEVAALREEFTRARRSEPPPTARF